MRSRAPGRATSGLLIAFALSGCARTPSPSPQATGEAGVAAAVPSGAPTGASILEGCTREEDHGAIVWSCGEAFLAMEASIDGAPSAAVDENLARFAEPFAGHVVARDDAPWIEAGEPHRAIRLRVDLPEKGVFVATMVVVARAGRVRVASCSAKLADAGRCEAVLRHLVGRAAAP